MNTLHSVGKSEQILQATHFCFLKHTALVFNASLPLDKECLACYGPSLGLTGMCIQNADNARTDTPQVVLLRAQKKTP